LSSKQEILKSKIDPKKVPNHIAIIMDGNGRWAKSQGKDRIFGHQNAINAVTESVEGCAEIGVKFLTLYAFSTENWNRPKPEVTALMELLISTIHQEIETLNKNNIRLQAIGDLKSLPNNCYNELNQAIEETSKNSKMTLVLALSYSAKWEILEAIKNIMVDGKNNQVKPEDVNEDLFRNYLSTKNIPDPELMIRTSGEYRISNFLLWQLAYAELKFLEKFWPDFNREDLFNAVIEFQGRERRFGKISEQLTQQ
jgi:undecaprenyl diphosphate synthase